MGNIIGMHNHRVGAKNSLADFFNECLEANISTVSITDHKTLDTYIKEFPKLSPEEIKIIRKITFVILITIQKMKCFTIWKLHTK